MTPEHSNTCNPGRVGCPSDPEISIVVASRNDDHGGSLLSRMGLFSRAMFEQAERHGLDAELIIVEWNPLPGAAMLYQVLPRKPLGNPLRVRYITVPQLIHERFDRGRGIPFLQWTAKNVGIRRARGRFVVVTNMDILFSDPLCHILAKGSLETDKMYRANRWDVPASIVMDRPLDEVLQWCHDNKLRRFGKTNADGPSLRHWLGRWWRSLRGSQDAIHRAESGVDTHACGDFTLMSREVWFELRGYPEIKSHAYVDGLACHAAVACGHKQIVFPGDACVYHVEHRGGWESMTIKEKLQCWNERPTLDCELYWEAVRWMHRNQQCVGLNGDSWGCAGDELAEKTD
jgi:hypothetical protein